MNHVVQYLSICLVLSLLKYGYCRSTKEHSLEQVHVIFRHGDRTPDRHVIYHNDPYINETYYPLGHGQLTNLGKRKEYLLGKALRKRYKHFLEEEQFTYDILEARSTDYNRTKASLQLVLASLFPPKGSQIWEKRLKWQPIPYNYWPLSEDHVLGYSYDNCPKFIKLYDEYVETHKEQLFGQYKDVISYISEHSGEQLNAKTLSEFYFTFTIEKEFGFKLPDWAEKLYPKIVMELTCLDYKISTATKELMTLSVGNFMKKVVDDIRAKIKNPDEIKTKIFLYSAHEYNIAYIMHLLEIFYPHVPPYASYLILEIHNIKGQRAVKVLYQDYSSEKPKTFTIPGCKTLCPFEKFVSMYEKYFPKPGDAC